MESDEFPTVAALVRHIHERSDEIAKAIVIPPGLAFFENDQQVLQPEDYFMLLLRLKNGDSIVVRGDPVERVLNNGILNRMSIKIELWMGVQVAV